MSTLRLTLRTLLAYLDDTLDPGEIKSIGEKVGDSTTAQETIARVKKLVRRRRLTTPPFTGPGARFDANTIAEYLDNALDSDTVTELESFCLEKDPTADLYLAEVASCHQILTLVLGEPVMVPATAKQRMYGLVQGREAIPFRKPPTAVNNPQLPASSPDMDLDDGNPFLGLSPRKSPWLAWAVPAIAALLLVGAGLALFFALPHLTDEPRKPSVPIANNDSNKDKDRDTGPAKDKDATGPAKDKDAAGPAKDKDAAGPTKDKDAVPTKDKDAVPTKDKDAVPTKDKDAVVKDKDGGMKDGGKEPTPGIERPVAASVVKAEVATYNFDRNNPTILLQKQENTWKRLPPNARVSSAEQLVALPGFPCAVKTDKGVNLVLRGFLPQFATPGIEVTTRLLDCSATLHQNSNVDADLTLHRGRLHISNGTQPATVILRFWKEAWIIRLTAPNSEVGIDLVTRYTPAINYLDGEEPEADLYFVLLQGKAGLTVDTFQFPNMAAPPMGPSFYAWNNKKQRMLGPDRIPEAALTIWNNVPPQPPTRAAQDMSAALKEIAALMIPPKAINIVLKEGLSNPNPADRLLCIYSLASIDQIDTLLDVLADEDQAHVLERDEATYAIRRWISRSAENNLKLYNEKKTPATGMLISKGYLQTEALTLVTLLHGLSNLREAGADDPKSRLGYLINNMRSDRVAIRHVAQYLLDTLTASVQNKPAFNAASSLESREAAVKRLREMLESGALTPMPMRPGGPGPGPGGVPRP
jgi:hypothetical protein